MNMPAGEYRIGDPCYSIADEDWDDFLRQFWAAGKRGGIFEYKGKLVACWFTAYGDGCYDYDGYDIPVDAGCIAALPIEVCNTDSGGWVYAVFSGDWQASYNDGTFDFAGEKIYTGDEDERHGDYCSHCGR